MHRANGGYLLLDAIKVVSQPYAWEGLKRALKASQVRIESLGQAHNMISTVSLQPQPIPMKVKIVLIGDAQLFYRLNQFDPEFEEFFKVAADFDRVMERAGDGEVYYARMIATLARQQNLKPLDRSGVARLIEHGSRLAGDGERLSTRMRDVEDLLVEANHYTRRTGRRSHPSRRRPTGYRRTDFSARTASAPACASRSSAARC